MPEHNVQSALGRLKEVFFWPIRLPRWPLIWLISLYQKTLSPDHGLLKGLFPHGYCKFHPTCSEYGKLSLKKFGLLRGLPRAVWRIIRCNPWSQGGEDWP
jgi:hypothetical protein